MALIVLKPPNIKRFSEDISWIKGQVLLIIKFIIGVDTFN